MSPSNWANSTAAGTPPGAQCQCSNWPGTGCDARGNVVSLSLIGAANTLPPSISRLSSLSALSFSAVNFTQSITWAIPPMASVLELDLASAGNAPSPLQDLGWVSAFGALRVLAVGQGFSGVLPDELSVLRQLTVLDLSFSGLEFLPSWLPGLSDLQVLNATNAKVYQSLPSWLGQLGALKQLDLSGNTLWGPLPDALFNATRLSHLDLSNNRLTGPIPTRISDLVLLTSIYLESNNLSGQIPSECFQLKRLLHLHLESNSLPGPLPINLAGALLLHELALSHNPLRGSFPTEIVQLRRLSVLLISDCQLSGTLPLRISELTLLATLGLGSNNLSGTLEPLTTALQLNYLAVQIGTPCRGTLYPYSPVAL